MLEVREQPPLLVRRPAGNHYYITGVFFIYGYRQTETLLHDP